MSQGITTDKLAYEKIALHLKYVGGILGGIVLLVIILSFCEESFFQDCASVTSTVTSIILSAVAIILSVTGERATNEIRNKVADSVERLEIYAEKSGNLAEGLSVTLKTLDSLYSNITERFDNMPNMDVPSGTSESQDEKVLDLKRNISRRNLKVYLIF